MKNTILLFVFVFILFSCSGDSTSDLKSGDGQGGSIAIFVLKGNYLYTVDNNKLNVFSLLDINTPVKVNAVLIGFDIETLFSFGENLYIGSRNGMFIYSIVNPENPTKLSQVQHFTACDPVVANATHSFVTLHSNTTCGNNINVLEIFDTSNPQLPILKHRRNLSYPKGLSLYNNYLFVCDDVIKVFNIQNPAEPVLVKSISNVCFDLIIRNNEMYAIGNQGVYRYTLDPTNIDNITFRSQVLF